MIKNRIVNTEQIVRMDNHTINQIGIPSMVLMENAAKSWVEAALNDLPKTSELYIFCGSGNNGGDGYAIARILQSYNYQCSVVAIFPPKTEDCLKNEQIWRKYGKVLSFQDFKSRQIHPSTIIIDAILGTGTTGEVKDELAKKIQYINEKKLFTIAVDVPSGINSSTGDTQIAIQANITITFQKEKVGLFLYPGKKYTGKIICQNITIQDYFQTEEIEYYKIDQTLVKKLLPIRKENSYKNIFGHLGVWCGSDGMLGAAAMASIAGLKVGTGLVTTFLSPIYQSILNHNPEIMFFSPDQLTDNHLLKYKALVIGCGLGRKKNQWEKIKPLIHNYNKPMILDADAFYGIDDWSFLNDHEIVLTPHLGEFSAMTGYAKPESNKTLIEQGLKFSQQYPKVILVLKGAPTIIFTNGNKLFINTNGNAGMATAGSGDVLAGIIGGFLAQGILPLHAALISVWLHARSGDIYKDKYSEESLTAMSLIENLPEAIKL